MKLTTLITTCIDPAIDYIQKDSMVSFYNFMMDASTPVETGFKVVATQLQDLATVVQGASDDCLKKQGISARRITMEYDGVIKVASDCIRNASASYRAPINEFTRVHFVALPLINRINSDVNQCANGNKNDQCVAAFLAKYCDDASKCKDCATM